MAVYKYKRVANAYAQQINDKKHAKKQPYIFMNVSSNFIIFAFFPFDYQPISHWTLATTFEYTHDVFFYNP